MKFLLGIGYVVLPTLKRAALPLGVGLVCIALATGGDTVREFVRYDRTALEANEIWRLAGAHFVHLGWPHMWLNVIALALLALLFDRMMTAADWLAALLLSMLGVDAGLYCLAPEVGWYVGLSGVLHGLLLAGAVALIAQGSRLGYVLLGGLILKLAWEQAYGAVPLSAASAGGPVIVDAHLYGAVGGVVAAAWSYSVRRRLPARL